MTISKPYHTVSGHNIECVDLNDAFEKGSPVDKRKAEKLLATVHAGIYCDAFPIPCEQESLEYWLGNLQNGRENGQQLLSVFGKNLDSKDPEIMGFICSRTLNDSNCALIDYIIRVKKHEHIISGAEISDHAEKGLNELNMLLNGEPLKAIFWEVNDPAKIKWDENDPNRHEVDCMDPEKRIKIISGKGYEAEEVGFGFVQGPLDVCETQEEIDEGICDTLKLYKLKSQKYNKTTVEDARKFVINYNKRTNGMDDPRKLNNGRMTEMMDQLDLMKKLDIPLMEKMQTEEQQEMIQNASEMLKKYVTGPSYTKQRKSLEIA